MYNNNIIPLLSPIWVFVTGNSAKIWKNEGRNQHINNIWWGDETPLPRHGVQRGFRLLPNPKRCHSAFALPLFSAIRSSSVGDDLIQWDLWSNRGRYSIIHHSNPSYTHLDVPRSPVRPSHMFSDELAFSLSHVRIIAMYVRGQMGLRPVCPHARQLSRSNTPWTPRIGPCVDRRVYGSGSPYAATVRQNFSEIAREYTGYFGLMRFYIFY